MVHIAGPMSADGVQLCVRCGHILTDYRGAMVPTEDAKKPLGGWAVGAHVETEGANPAWSGVTNKPADCKAVV